MTENELEQMFIEIFGHIDILTKEVEELKQKIEEKKKINDKC